MRHDTMRLPVLKSDATAATTAARSWSPSSAPSSSRSSSPSSKKRSPATRRGRATPGGEMEAGGRRRRLHRLQLYVVITIFVTCMSLWRSFRATGPPRLAATTTMMTTTLTESTNTDTGEGNIRRDLGHGTRSSEGTKHAILSTGIDSSMGGDDHGTKPGLGLKEEYDRDGSDWDVEDGGEDDEDKEEDDDDEKGEEGDEEVEDEQGEEEKEEEDDDDDDEKGEEEDDDEDGEVEEEEEEEKADKSSDKVEGEEDDEEDGEDDDDEEDESESENEVISKYKGEGEGEEQYSEDSDEDNDEGNKVEDNDSDDEDDEKGGSTDEEVESSDDADDNDNDKADTEVVPVHGWSPSEPRGMAGCVLVLEDTIRLSEWMAYHYTVMPLSRLVIAMDPRNSPRAVERINHLVEKWRHYEHLDVVVWQDKDFIPPYIHRKKAIKGNPYKMHKERQCQFVTKCLRNHKKHGQNWTVLTDTDEFLAYNVRHDDERNHFFDRTLVKNRTVLESERRLAVPMRESLPSVSNQTIADYLHQHEKEIGSLTPQSHRCLRLPGLFYGIKESPDRNDIQNSLSPNTTTAVNNAAKRLMTLRYRRYNRKRGSRFSKVMVDVSKISRAKISRLGCNTIHNPVRYSCGKNGMFASGQDYISSVFRINHYLGSKRSYLERQDDARGRSWKMYRRKKRSGGPYSERGDRDLDGWLDAFVRKVGTDAARSLLELVK